MIQWEKDGLAVPLSQLTVIKSTNKQTKQAVEDWHYWVQMGYTFG
ncbi:MAG: calcium-binding protein [Thermodesulfobacteriota bacterium]